MEDYELENKIKQSAEKLEVKDFSSRKGNIQKIVDNAPEKSFTPVFAKQPVTAVAGGRGTSGRNALIAAAICFISAALIVAAVVIFLFSTANKSSQAVSYSDAADGDRASVFSGGSAVYDGDQDLVTEGEFYYIFTSAADFSPYSAVYYIYYEGGLLTGKVQFEYNGASVTAYLYRKSVEGGYEYDGIYYIFAGSLPDGDLQQLTENLFS